MFADLIGEGGHARDCVTKPAESLNRFSSYSDTSVSKRPSDTWLQTATEECRQRPALSLRRSTDPTELTSSYVNWRIADER